VQRADRQRLQAVNLDSPSIPLLPVSAGLLLAGRHRRDEALVAASGIPQLLEFMRDRVALPVDVPLHDAVLADVRLVTDQPTRGCNAELDILGGSGLSARERQDRAVAELDRRQQSSAAWQTTLGDGITELVSQVDFDLRDRLGHVLDGAEKTIKTSNPTSRWKRFNSPYGLTSLMRFTETSSSRAPVPIGSRSGSRVGWPATPTAAAAASSCPSCVSSSPRPQ
jgi:hypothetical protein